MLVCFLKYNSTSAMFRNTLQTGLITILCGSGLNPLEPWKVHCRGCVRRLTDEDVQTLVYELTAVQFCTTYISLPQTHKNSIGIRLPFMTMVVKNMKMPFCFEFQVCAGFQIFFRSDIGKT